jgi:Ca-activated chloride channel homolog
MKRFAVLSVALLVIGLAIVATIAGCSQSQPKTASVTAAPTTQPQNAGAVRGNAQAGSGAGHLGPSGIPPEIAQKLIDEQKSRQSTTVPGQPPQTTGDNGGVDKQKDVEGGVISVNGGYDIGGNADVQGIQNNASASTAIGGNNNGNFGGGGGGRRGGRGGAGGGGFAGGGGGAPGAAAGAPRAGGGAGGGGAPRGGGGGRRGPGVANLQTGIPGAQFRPAIVVPLQNEELWIIAKPQQVALAAPGMDDRNPGAGALLAKLPNRTEQVAVPLKHTDVKASIAGYIATVNVQQQYQNPYAEKIEAVYVFPLPQNAAVNEFLMTIGDRKIRGIIRDRQEAEQIYQEARAQGYVASLLTQERPNIFTQSVANIEPGKEIDIDIKYFHTLEYVDGWYEWHFPMVVGPRFNPSSSAGDGIGAVAMGARGTSGQSTEVQYLRPDQRSGHDISLNVTLDAGVKIEQLESPSHKIVTQTHGDASGVSEISLSSSDSIPNKDFVLRYKVAGKTVKSAMMVQRDPKGGGGYFTLMLVPPESLSNVKRQPLEMVFTLDVSGSMSGRPFEQARAAIAYALNHMQPTDTFQIVRFANQTELMTPTAVPATQENVRAGIAYIAEMRSGGGTQMLEGIRDSLNFHRDPERSRYVAFLTDGYIGNEAEILREVHNSVRDSRIFSFGVNGSPNRYLLDHMARMGAGAAAYPSPDDNPDEYMAPYFERISHPAMTDISVDFGGMQVSDVYPQKISDLFVGRPVIITGRFTGDGAISSVHMRGRIAGESSDFAIPVKLDDQQAQHVGVKSVWARMKISDLAERSVWDNGFTDAQGSIKQLALNYNLMSQFTAFVAVDSSIQTAGDHGMSVKVPVPVPEGVDFDSTVAGPQRGPAPARGVQFGGPRAGGGGGGEQ